jgi:GT2 family glycosyltransferase
MSDIVISVIVPHYQDLDRLEICLAALRDQSIDARSFEVIVSDNGSQIDAGDLERAVTSGNGKLVITREKGAGLARNGGVAVARGKYLAFVDSDCVPEPSWLKEGLAALELFDFVGGRVRVLVADPKRMTPIEAFERVFAFDIASYVKRKGFAGSGNLFCPRTLFDKVGGFRTGVSEDIEWSHRAAAAGFRLGYASKAIVGHPARRNWSDLLKKWKRVNEEQFKLLAERHGGKALWVARALLMPASAVAHTPRVLLSRDLQSWNDRLSALRVLFRIRLWRAVDGLRLAFREKEVHQHES